MADVALAFFFRHFFPRFNARAFVLSRQQEFEADRAAHEIVGARASAEGLQAFVDQYHGLTLKQINLPAMLSELITLLRQHQLALPADLSLLFKSFLTLEGMGRELDGDFNMVNEALPLLKEAVRARYRPRALLQRGWRAVDDTLSMLGGLPQDLSRLLKAARRGRLEVHIDIGNLTRVGNQVESALNRLVVGLVVAALIVGSSIVMTVPGGPTLLGLPFFGLLGFVGAVLGSLWLIVSISRSSRSSRDNRRN